MTGCANCGHAWLDHPGGEHCTRCSCHAWEEQDALGVARAPSQERSSSVLRAREDARR